MKSFLLLIASLSVAASALAQFSDENVLNMPPVADESFIYPESFDTDTKKLQDNWYLQRYTVLDSISRMSVDASTPDDVIIERLRRLPTVIEMPYNSYVRRFIDMYANSRPQLVEKMLGMSLYYMPIFEEALERHGLPLELKYLPVIESALDPNAKSRAGAVGLWQFMPGTATGEGLEVNSLVDERRDPIASTEAAAKYLKKLYDIYGDWTMAIAAYNCGAGNVNKAIKRAGGGKKDFWQIWRFLPEETRNYVPAFIAANYIMNYYGAHGISPALARRPLVTDTVHVSQRVHFKQISDVLGVSIEGLRILNPQYRQDIIPGNIHPYTLILPSVQAYCYVANEDSILAHDRQLSAQPGVVIPDNGSQVVGKDDTGEYVDEVSYVNHTVRRGETLKSIASKYKVTTEDIRKANNLRSTKVRRGQVLKIPQTKRTYTGDTPQAPADTAAVVDAAVVDAAVVDVAVVEAPDSAAVAVVPPVEVKADSVPAAEAPKQPEAPAKPQPSYTTYTVKSGDSLSRIAAKYHTTVAKIKQLNNLKSDMLHPGQKLKIPKK